MSLLAIPAALLGILFASAFATFAVAGFLNQAGTGLGFAPPFTLANYGRFLADAAGLETLLFTFAFSAAITAATVLVGYPTAYIVARARSAAVRNVMLGALVLTFLSGSISRAYGWLIILGRRGMLNDLLLASGLIDRPLALVYNQSGVFIALLHFTLPFFVLTVFGSVRAVPPGVEEAARDLGAGPWTTFRKVAFPLTLPAVVSGATLVFSLGISAFAFPLLLGGGRVRLMSNFIYDQLFVSFDLPFAAAAAGIFLAAAVLSLVLLFRLERVVGRSLHHEA